MEIEIIAVQLRRLVINFTVSIEMAAFLLVVLELKYCIRCEVSSDCAHDESCELSDVQVRS